MRILIVDDEQIALDNLRLKLQDFAVIQDITAFRSPQEVLDFPALPEMDLAFLDISMRGMSGLGLAKRLRERAPHCAIVFVTGYSQYAVQAFELRVSGYLLKPVTREALARELDFIHSHLPPKRRLAKTLRVQCFGQFEVFFRGEPLHLRLAKSRELFAYLVDCRGAFCDINTLCAVLWEEKPDSPALKSHLRHVIADLSAALRHAGLEGLLLRRRGLLAVLPAAFDCDYYDFLAGDPLAKEAYKGAYMQQYSWAEMTAGSLSIDQ